MWSSQEHCRARGRPPGSEPATLRDYSHSPPRTPKEPTHTAHGFLVYDTPGADDNDSYFALPANPTTGEDHIATSASHKANLVSDHQAIGSDALEQWKAFEIATKDDPASTNSMGAKPNLPKAVTVVANAKFDVSEPSDYTVDESVVPDAPVVVLPTLESLYSKRPPPVRARLFSASKHVGTTVMADVSKSVYGNAKHCSVQFLQSLLDSPKIDIEDEVTGEIYVRGVSLNMLKYFCGAETIGSLLQDSIIRVPPTHASKDGMIRLIRYIRRWCQNSSMRPLGELRTPPSVKEGIATSLACRFLHLDSDAEHLEKLVVQDFIGNQRFFITDEDVELIWCGYEATLRETSFGDAVLWFVLEQVMSGTHALADEIRWLLKQEEYEDLKTRVRCELKKAEWRSLGRKEFLGRCRKNREDKVAACIDRTMAGDGYFPDGDIALQRKPLPRVPIIR